MATKFSLGAKSYNIPFSLSLLNEVWYGGYDVVIAEGVTNIVHDSLLYPICKAKRIPFIWWDAGRRRNAQRNIFRRMADPLVDSITRGADACIAYGSVARDYMISSGAQKEKIFVANNTINIKNILQNIAEDKKDAEQIRQQMNLSGGIILYVGVIEKRKKLENLIEAFQRLKQSYTQPVSLIIVGDGPYLQPIVSWTKSGGYEQDIHFLGRIVDGVGAYFAMCDLFVLPSEGGLALNQAMAYAKPLIATSADGTEVDLISDGWNGFIVEEDNIGALSAAMEQVLSDRDEQQRMGANSLQRISEEFTLQRMVIQFQHAISSALDGKSSYY